MPPQQAKTTEAARSLTAYFLSSKMKPTSVSWPHQEWQSHLATLRGRKGLAMRPFFNYF